MGDLFDNISTLLIAGEVAKHVKNSGNCCDSCGRNFEKSIGGTCMKCYKNLCSKCMKVCKKCDKVFCPKCISKHKCD